MTTHGTPDDKRREGDEAHRDQREDPHGSGDRTTVSPEAPDDVDRDFEGGTQRTAEPDGKPADTSKR